MRSFSIYVLLFFLYSFLGWCLEVGCKLVSERKFVNRGFLIGPYCPIYGFGALFMTLFLRRYLDDPITLFIMIVLSCSILEYFTSYFLEKIYHTRWWDYTKYRFNINGRICLETMIPFGLFGLLIMYKVNPFFLHILEQIPPLWGYILAFGLLFLFLLDNIVSSKAILEIQKINKNVQKKILIHKDDTERITKLVREKVEKSKKILETRVIHAFPHLKLLKQENLFKRTIQKKTKGKK